jgi:hypothetical protein
MMINDNLTIRDCPVGRDVYQTCLGERNKIVLVSLVMPGLPCAN